MLVRASGLILPDFHLLTLGRSCHYLLGPHDEFYLFDPGLSAHAPMLLKRLNDRQYSIKNCKGIFLTHLHPERAGVVPYLRQLNPKIELISSPQIKMKLKNSEFVKDIYESDQKLSSLFQQDGSIKQMSLSEYQDKFAVTKTLVDSDFFDINEDVGFRVISFAVHTTDSLAYFLEPYNFLIADEGVGFYNGRNSPGPGCDFSIDNSLESLGRLTNLDISGLCMTNSGVLTAQLVRKHLAAVLQNTKDILTESGKAMSASVDEDVIKSSIKESFYNLLNPDPLLIANAERSFSALWQQLKQKHSAKNPAST